MNLVLDASVIVKWTLDDPEEEDNVDRALDLLRAIGQGEVHPLQPCHWLAEVAAVLTRLMPDKAERAVALLDAMEFTVIDDLPTLQRASQLARKLEHHLFDTLYHAVALESGAELITADRRYWRKARSLGRVRLLDSYS